MACFFILVEDWVQNADRGVSESGAAAFATALACCALDCGHSDFWNRPAQEMPSTGRKQALGRAKASIANCSNRHPDAIFLIDTATDRIVRSQDMATMLYGSTTMNLLAKKGTDLSGRNHEDTRQHIQAARRAPGEVFRIPLRLYRQKKRRNRLPVEITTRSLSAGKRCSCSSRPATSPSASGRRKPCGIADATRAGSGCDAVPHALVDVQGSNIGFLES